MKRHDQTRVIIVGNNSELSRRLGVIREPPEMHSTSSPSSHAESFRLRHTAPIRYPQTDAARRPLIRAWFISLCIEATVHLRRIIERRAALYRTYTSVSLHLHLHQPDNSELRGLRCSSYQSKDLFCSLHFTFHFTFTLTPTASLGPFQNLPFQNA